MTPLLEVIATTVEDAVEAEAGGAGRIELVVALDRDGLTPPLSLVEQVVSRVRIPVRVMIRDQEPFHVSDAAVVASMCAAAAAAARLPIDGLVVGGVDEARRVDEALLVAVMAAAPGVPLTFHRAFETVVDEEVACAALVRARAVDRVLVRGVGGDWRARLDSLLTLRRRLGPGIRPLAAAGQDTALIAAVGADRELGEIHVGRAARDPEDVRAPVSARKVRALVDLLFGR